MKKILLLSIITSCFFGNISFGQQISNGDMEQWHYTFDLADWREFGAALFCVPEPLVATKTNDRNSGTWACELQAKGCINEGGIYLIYVGGILCSSDTSQYFVGQPYHERPGALNFYYKFNSVGNDTGYAWVALRLLDSAQTIVGDGKVYIINDVNTYTPMFIPLNYYLPNTPQIIQIIFSTYKPLTGHPYPPGSTGEAGVNAHAGTTLWIDDVTLSGGTIGINDYSEIKKIKIYPNPLTSSSNLQFNTQLRNAEVVIYNMLGKEMVRKRMDGDTMEIEKGSLESGVYFVRVSTEERQYVQKIIIE